jgi:hypothetical protein
MQAYLHKPPRLKGAQLPAKGWPTLLFFLYALKNTNKHFWRRCRGMVVVIISKPNSSVYPCVLSFFSKKVIPLILPHHEPLPFKKIFLLQRTSLEPPPSKPITASG